MFIICSELTINFVVRHLSARWTISQRSRTSSPTLPGRAIWAPLSEYLHTCPCPTYFNSSPRNGGGGRERNRITIYLTTDTIVRVYFYETSIHAVGFYQIRFNWMIRCVVVASLWSPSLWHTVQTSSRTQFLGNETLNCNFNTRRAYILHDISFSALRVGR